MDPRGKPGGDDLSMWWRLSPIAGELPSRRKPNQRLVMTISRYSLGTTIVPSPERLNARDQRR